MSIKQFVKQNIDDLLLFSCVSGSHAYGMATPESDVDTRGVFILPERHALSPFHKLEQIDGEGDTVFFELRKFLFMLSKQNPNILELLWVPDDCVKQMSDTWQLLDERREFLLSKKLAHTFGGYAYAQLKKMRSHEKWINKPQPKDPPMPCSFVSVQLDMTGGGLLRRQGMPRQAVGYQLVHIHKDSYLLFSKEGRNWYDETGGLCTVEKRESEDVKKGRAPLAVVNFNRNEYEAAKKNWENYWNWKSNRNPERGAIEEKVGYDTKNASHLIRLLLTGRDALKDGELTVRRPEAEFLLDIRRGKLGFDEVISLANQLENELRQAETRSELPDDIDQEMLEDILIEMYRYQKAVVENRSESSFSV